MNELIHAFRRESQKIVWVRQVFKADLSDTYLALRRSSQKWTIEGTNGCELLSELSRDPEEHEVIKKRYSAFFETEHTRQGAVIKTGARLASLTGTGGKVTQAVLADGSQLDADIVLVGIGILPNVELAEAAGIACSNGILTDRDARTNDPRIFAAGDCAARPLVHYGRKGRLESVHNAIEQGKLSAAAIVGKPRPPEDCPWFWSDQYDLKLQIAGLSLNYDETVLRGDPETRKFAVFYLQNGKLIAVDAVNSPPEFLASKKLIMTGARLAPETLSDTSQSMKEIAAAAV